jgi:DNA modification methylase
VQLYEDIGLFVEAAKKPRIVRFRDGIVIHGEFGSTEVAKLLPKKLPLIIADVPYGVLEKSIDWDQGITADDYVRWTKDCLALLKKGGSLYIYGGIGRPHDRIFFEFVSKIEDEIEPAHIRDIITWQKKKAIGSATRYLFQREEIAWIVNGDKPAMFKIPLLDKLRGYDGWDKNHPAKSKYLRRGNVWSDVVEKFRDKFHRCEKPTKLAEIMIETHTRKGDTVLDPFAGSGSTAFACRALGRKFILIERDKKNFDIIVKRLERSSANASELKNKSLGKKAELFAALSA